MQTMATKAAKTFGYDQAPDINEDYVPDLRVVDVDAIDVNEWNPNAMDLETFNTLVDAVKKEGMNQPVMVRLSKTEGRYELIDGEHRFKATKVAGLKKIMV